MTVRIATVTLNPAIDHTAAVPNFQIDAVNRVTWNQADAGGKGVNVASFLAGFGVPVAVTGILGEENPELFDRLFAQKGIQDHFVRLPGKTRVNIKIVDDAQHQVTDINFPGLTLDGAALERVRGAIAALADTHDWFVFSGSLPAGTATTAYHDLIHPLKEQGKTVILDTSGDALRHALPAKPDLIKPNLAELQEILGKHLPTHRAIVEAVRDLIASGIPQVVVSLGAHGALFINDTEALHAKATAPDIKSTVGAGDAMVAGTVLGLSRGESWADCATLATAFSLGALGQIGPRLPDWERIEELREMVEVKRVRSEE